ncbi:MAG: PLP-dependent transferase [Hyphomicrobiaceae bacterium]
MVLAETFGDFAFAIACRVMGLRDLGPSISPFNAFLITTGIETLPLRMERHCANALTVARYLEAHSAVAWVNYAGLESNKYHAIAKRICPAGAGLSHIRAKRRLSGGRRVCRCAGAVSHLANIGDTRSLVIHPASTTHSQLTSEQRAAAGAGDDVVRLSIGIEDAADIIADLDQALAKASA